MPWYPVQLVSAFNAHKAAVELVQYNIQRKIEIQAAKDKTAKAAAAKAAKAATELTRLNQELAEGRKAQVAKDLVANKLAAAAEQALPDPNVRVFRTSRRYAHAAKAVDPPITEEWLQEQMKGDAQFEASQTALTDKIAGNRVYGGQQHCGRVGRRV